MQRNEWLNSPVNDRSYSEGMNSQRMHKFGQNQSQQNHIYTTTKRERGRFEFMLYIRKQIENKIKCEIVEIQNLIHDNKKTLQQIMKQMMETAKLIRGYQEKQYLLMNEMEKRIKEKNEQRIHALREKRKQKQKQIKQIKEEIEKERTNVWQLNHYLINLKFDIIKLQQTSNQKEIQEKTNLLIYDKLTKIEIIKELQQTLQKYKNQLQFKIRQRQSLQEELNKIDDKDFILILFHSDLNVQQTNSHINDLKNILVKSNQNYDQRSLINFCENSSRTRTNYQKTCLTLVEVEKKRICFKLNTRQQYH